MTGKIVFCFLLFLCSVTYCQSASTAILNTSSGYFNASSTARAASAPSGIAPLATAPLIGSTTVSAIDTTITGFPGATGLCCNIYPVGVGVNSWYTEPVSLITATVHKT